MKSVLSFALSLAGILTLTPPAFAADLGDAAPPLQIAEWIKGKPVDLAAAKGKQVVVVEFWATWCPPCRTSIPHLTEMQKKFKDVRFVGVSDEDVAIVKKFVAQMGDKMDYTVAVDKDVQTAKAYLGAFGDNRIPQAFIVGKEGSILWRGFPAEEFEQALEEVVAGKFDLEKSKKRVTARERLEEFTEVASRDLNDPTLKAMGEELEALDGELGGIQAGKKFVAAEVIKQIKFQRLENDYELAVQSGRGGTNLANIEKQLDASAPRDFDLATFKAGVALAKLANDYLNAARGNAGSNELAELTKQLTAAKPQDPRLSLQIAQIILSDGSLKPRNYELAAKFARYTVDATGSKEPMPLYYYARALFESGKVDEAITWQKKTIEAAGGNEGARKEMEDTLKKYQAKAAAK